MDTTRDLERLAGSLDRIGEVLDAGPAHLGRRAEAVSAWSVAQHLQHTLVALRGVLVASTRLLDGRDETIDHASSPWVRTRAILALGKIPRGRGQAPEEARPDDAPDLPALRQTLVKARRRVEALDRRATAIPEARGTIPHHHFGPLDAALWIRFAEIHTRHHLSIIDDVVEAVA